MKSRVSYLMVFVRSSAYFVGESCNFPLGMQSGEIESKQLTSSSDFSKYHTAARGRIGITPDKNGEMLFYNHKYNQNQTVIM